MAASSSWLHGSDDDGYDEDDDQTEDEQDDEEQDSDQDEGDQEQDQDQELPDADEAEAAVANAHPDEVEAHRNLIGDVLSHLSDRGIDIDAIAEDAGVSSSDVQELTHGDLAGMTQYLAQNHPELLQSVSDRYPAAQNILGAVTGGGGIGGILGRFLGH